MTESPETPQRSHLKPVSDDAPPASPAPAAPAPSQGGGHLTGLLALLLAVAVFAFLAQLSESRSLAGENEALATALAESQAELAEARAQMGEARDALGGLRDVLARIEGLLAPPAAEGAAGAGEPPAPAPE